ncbi:hypothetical protein INR49_026942 [Caranx melampygus]|nr:hypothetical protein INR49_026942 [Caranx melampygus]
MELILLLLSEASWEGNTFVLFLPKEGLNEQFEAAISSVRPLMSGLSLLPQTICGSAVEVLLHSAASASFWPQPTVFVKSNNPHKNKTLLTADQSLCSVSQMRGFCCFFSVFCCFNRYILVVLDFWSQKRAHYSLFSTLSQM